MTLTSNLPEDVLTGMPMPTRGRWQPQRAGITGLFHYDAQVFTFYQGRLLLRGNNGNGKSMALEVLLPFVLVADTDPSQLSTFGNRNRTFYTWLLDHDPSKKHASARGAVWVEFARLGPLGQPEFFTVGVLLEGVRKNEKVTPHYFTSAGRIGVDLDLGAPGQEAPTRDALAAQLDQLTSVGLSGAVRSGRQHRSECNRVLFGLPDDSYRSLLKALRQLRRPKLSDKLSQKALAEILRDSLPSIDRALITGIAKGYERLDRHQDDIKNLRLTIDGLRDLDLAYKRYARAILWQRAHAISACELALERAERKAKASGVERDRLAKKVTDCEQRKGALEGDVKRFEGRLSGIQASKFYKEGADLKPFLEQVELLESVAQGSQRRAEQSQARAQGDAEARAQAEDRVQASGDKTRMLRQTTQVHGQSWAVIDDIFHELCDSLDEADSTGGQMPISVIRDQLRERKASLRERLSRLAAMAAKVAEATTAAAALGIELETRREELVAADEFAAGVNENLRNARDEFLAEARAWMAHCDQLTASGTPWNVDLEPSNAVTAVRQWRDEAFRTRTAQLNDLTDQLNGPAGSRLHPAAADMHRRLGELVDIAHDTASAQDAAHRKHAQAQREWLRQCALWAETLIQLPVHAPAMPTLDTYAPDPWQEWVETAVSASGLHHRAAEEELHLRRRKHDVEVDRCQVRRDQLGDEHEAVSNQAALTPPTPATRLDSREGRPGAPLYLLIDFSDGGLDVGSAWKLTT